MVVPEVCVGHQVDGRDVAVRRVEFWNDLLQGDVRLYLTREFCDSSVDSLTRHRVYGLYLTRHRSNLSQMLGPG